MTSNDSLQALLDAAIGAARGGDRVRAYQLLRQVIAADPSNEAAWLWFAVVADQPREARLALRRVERLNPHNPRLDEARRWLESRSLASAVAPASLQAEPAAAPSPARDGEAATTRPRGDTRPVPVIVPPDSEPGVEPPPPAGDEDTAPRKPLAEDTPVAPPPVRSRRRACRVLLTILLALALVAALAILVFVLWFRYSDALSGPLPRPTPDAQQRALALQPQLNAAIADSRWRDAVTALETMHALDPASAAWQHSAANAYYQLGVQRRNAGDLQAAVDALDRSLQLAPDVPFVQQERQWAAAVLEGLKQYTKRDWQAVIDILTPVHKQDPTYADVSEWLYCAYYNLGVDLQTAGELEAAQKAYVSALAVKPDQLAARQKVEEVAWLLRPPTPTTTPTPTASPTPTLTPTPAASPTPTATPTPDPASQLILVDISDQRMYVYEKDRLLWEWVVSTGKPGKDTAVGRYQVLDKIEMAYASTWNLDMPHWLGIYESGPLENGIHALPINRGTGLKLWEGFLGQRVSFGCVILDDDNARTLFQWVQVGARVIIQW